MGHGHRTRNGPLLIGEFLAREETEQSRFFGVLEDACESEEFRWQIRSARKLRRHHTFRFLGNSLPAHKSVVTAIACFSTSPNSYEDTIARAISQGDDTDTLAVMAGAISGAFLGDSAIPEPWLAQLENGPKGADSLRELARGLHEKFLAT